MKNLKISQKLPILIVGMAILAAIVTGVICKPGFQ